MLFSFYFGYINIGSISFPSLRTLDIRSHQIRLGQDCSLTPIDTDTGTETQTDTETQTHAHGLTWWMIAVLCCLPNSSLTMSNLGGLTTVSLNGIMGLDAVISILANLQKQISRQVKIRLNTNRWELVQAATSILFVFRVDATLFTLLSSAKFHPTKLE